MEEAMYAYLSDCLDEHDFAEDPDRRHAILDMDIKLNVQGIEVWLDRSAV